MVGDVLKKVSSDHTTATDTRAQHTATERSRQPRMRHRHNHSRGKEEKAYAHEFCGEFYMMKKEDTHSMILYKTKLKKSHDALCSSMLCNQLFVIRNWLNATEWLLKNRKKSQNRKKGEKRKRKEGRIRKGNRWRKKKSFDNKETRTKRKGSGRKKNTYIYMCKRYE